MPFSTDFALRVGTPPSRLRRYVFALGIVGAATLGRLALDPLVNAQIPHLPYLASAVIVSWFCGVETGVISVIVAAFVANYLFVEPRYELFLHTQDRIAMTVVGLVATGLVLLVASWRRTEVTLRQRAEELQILLDTVPAAVFVARDRHARRIEGNRFAAEYVRLPLGSNMSLTAPSEERPLTFRVVRDGRELVGDDLPVQQAMARGEEVKDNEFDFVYEDGTTRTLFGSATPLRDERGNVRGSIGAFMDVTERRRMESRLREQAEELEHANRVKDDFLATLGHELRTPLNAIVGWSSLLLKGGLAPQTVRRAHEAIARNAEAQRALIEDVLDVSRIVSGSLRLEARIADVVGPLNAAIESVRPYADEKKIAIKTSFRDGPATVLGDPARLQQVFLNLLSNAVKFTGPGGWIRIATDRVGPEVEVRVSDNGAGIPPDQLSRIFERFRQADSSATRKHNGLGLGLAIVRHLVELHGGNVTAESGGEGQGASLTVRLPFRAFEDRRQASARRRPPAPEEVPGGAPSLSGVSVLVVDDERDARELVSSVLRGAGATVEAAASGAEALSRVEAADPDVLVIDIAMPEMDGYSLIRQIRHRHSRVAAAPAIAFSAYARDEDRRQAMASGFQLHVAKPAKPDALIRAVATVREMAWAPVQAVVRGRSGFGGGVGHWPRGSPSS